MNDSTSAADRAADAPDQEKTRPASEFADEPRNLLARHLAIGWSLLCVYFLLGLVLEGLHGFKIGFYLDKGSEVRQQMWRLAHAHGAILGLVNLAFAWTITRLPQWPAKHRNTAAACLFSGSLLLPLGFFLGGINPYQGDPGIGVLLAPPGGILIVLCGALTARAAYRHRSP